MRKPPKNEKKEFLKKKEPDLTDAVVGVVIAGQRLMLDPVGGNTEAYAGSSRYPHSVYLVGLQFFESELSFIAPNFDREHTVCCGDTSRNRLHSWEMFTIERGTPACCKKGFLFICVGCNLESPAEQTQSLTLLQSTVFNVIVGDGSSATLRGQRVPHKPDLSR